MEWSLLSDFIYRLLLYIRDGRDKSFRGKRIIDVRSTTLEAEKSIQVLLCVLTSTVLVNDCLK